jgi:hypothetical protein
MPEFTYPTPTVITTTQAPPVPPVAPVVPPVNPTDVYSGGNIAQTLNAPVAKPDLSDPFGVRSFYLDSPEIKAAKEAAKATAEAINAAKSGLRTTTTALQNQNDQAMGGTGASINLIGRQVGRARDLTSNELAALSDNQLANNAYLDTLTQDATAKYQIAEGQRGQLQDLIRQTGGKAKIAYTDNYETAVSKAQSYLDKQAKQEKNDNYKQGLKAAALDLGLKTDGSTKDLEKRIKKVKASAISEAKRNADLAYKTNVAQYNKMIESTKPKTFDIASLFPNQGQPIPTTGNGFTPVNTGNANSYFTGVGLTTTN